MLTKREQLILSGSLLIGFGFFMFFRSLKFESSSSFDSFCSIFIN